MCVCVLIVSNGMSFPSGVIFSPLVSSGNNAFAYLGAIPARCTILKANFENQGRHWECLLVEFVKLKIHFSALWTVQMLNLWPSKYGCYNRTARTIAMHLRWDVSYSFSASMRARDQYPIDLVVSSGCFYIKTHSILTLHLSISSFMYPLHWGSSNISRVIKVFLSDSSAWSLFLLSVERLQVGNSSSTDWAELLVEKS